MPKIAPFEEQAAAYEKWFEENEFVFQSELNAIKRHFEALPPKLHGIEVGMASGRFSEALGIKEGIEPSDKMRQLAMNRGIEVMDAIAERLPYSDLQFDFVLFVTICYLEDVTRAFKEAYRVLDRDGSLIVGFIDRNSSLGKKYVEKKDSSTFYKHARFYSVEYVEKALKDAGFKDFTYYQTLFEDLDDITVAEAPKEGHGEGSFVVVRAVKKS